MREDSAIGCLGAVLLSCLGCEPRGVASADKAGRRRSAAAKEYVAGLDSKLTVHYLPGYAPDLYPVELVWSHATRTGNARRPLQKGERLADRITRATRRDGAPPRTRPLVLQTSKYCLYFCLLGNESIAAVVPAGFYLSAVVFLR